MDPQLTDFEQVQLKKCTLREKYQKTQDFYVRRGHFGRKI